MHGCHSHVAIPSGSVKRIDAGGRIQRHAVFASRLAAREAQTAFTDRIPVGATLRRPAGVADAFRLICDRVAVRTRFAGDKGDM